MSWILRYRCRIFLRSSLCAIPIACMIAAFLVAPLIRFIDKRTGHHISLTLSPEDKNAH